MSWNWGNIPRDEDERDNGRLSRALERRRPPSIDTHGGSTRYSGSSAGPRSTHSPFFRDLDSTPSVSEYSQDSMPRRNPAPSVVSSRISVYQDSDAPSARGRALSGRDQRPSVSAAEMSDLTDAFRNHSLSRSHQHHGRAPSVSHSLSGSTVVASGRPRQRELEPARPRATNLTAVRSTLILPIEARMDRAEWADMIRTGRIPHRIGGAVIAAADIRRLDEHGRNAGMGAVINAAVGAVFPGDSNHPSSRHRQARNARRDEHDRRERERERAADAAFDRRAERLTRRMERAAEREMMENDDFYEWLVRQHAHGQRRGERHVHNEHGNGQAHGYGDGDGHPAGAYGPSAGSSGGRRRR